MFGIRLPSSRRCITYFFRQILKSVKFLNIDSKFELKFSNFIALKIIFRPPPPGNPCLTGAHECSENAYCQVSNYGDLSYNRKFLPYECICKGWSTIIFLILLNYYWNRYSTIRKKILKGVATTVGQLTKILAQKELIFAIEKMLFVIMMGSRLFMPDQK